MPPASLICLSAGAPTQSHIPNHHPLPCTPHRSHRSCSGPRQRSLPRRRAAGSTTAASLSSRRAATRCAPWPRSRRPYATTPASTTPRWRSAAPQTRCRPCAWPRVSTTRTGYTTRGTARTLAARAAAATAARSAQTAAATPWPEQGQGGGLDDGDGGGHVVAAQGGPRVQQRVSAEVPSTVSSMHCSLTVYVVSAMLVESNHAKHLPHTGLKSFLVLQAV